MRYKWLGNSPELHRGAPDYTLSRTDFIVSMAEATKTCPHGQFCCLWSRWVSSCQRRRQQNPAFAVCTAAFGPGEFHRVNGGSSKNLLLRRDCCLWSRRASSGLRQKQQKPVSMVCSAAFGPDGFHRVDGGSSKNLHPKACLLPLVQMGFIVSTAEATENLLLRRYGCL